MTNQFKNPVFYCFVLVVIGIVLGIIGWDKNESTIPERTHGAVSTIVFGCVFIITGLAGFFVFGNKRKS